MGGGGGGGLRSFAALFSLARQNWKIRGVGGGGGGRATYSLFFTLPEKGCFVTTYQPHGQDCIRVIHVAKKKKKMLSRKSSVFARILGLLIVFCPNITIWKNPGGGGGGGAAASTRAKTRHRTWNQGGTPWWNKQAGIIIVSKNTSSAPSLKVELQRKLQLCTNYILCLC